MFSSPSLGIWPGEGFYVPDPCELTFANTLLLSNAAISLGNAFISLEISCSLLIIFSLFSFIFAWTFISLQIKEFRIMGLSINDSVYSLIIFCITLRIILSFKRIPVLTSLSCNLISTALASLSFLFQEVPELILCLVFQQFLHSFYSSSKEAIRELG